MDESLGDCLVFGEGFSELEMIRVLIPCRCGAS